MTLADRPARTRTIPALGWVLFVGGAIGSVAAFALLVDRIRLWEDPTYVPSCSINDVVGCGTVLQSWQSELFGFPNPLLGLAAFPVVATLGVVVLAEVALPRWIWWGLQAGATAGLVLVVWLIGQSLYVIGALCPYCMAVWAVTIAVFWYTTLQNLPSGHALVRWHWAVPLAAYLVVTALTFTEFSISA